MLPSSTISDFLGYTSIACWLGAQFPQVLENWRRKSCEGLALPFLANWLLGDLSNLIGCILTHQLPFQTNLATYFVLVDLSIVAQYWYYTGLTKSVPSFTGRSASVSRTRRVSIGPDAVRYRTLSAVAASVAATAALAAHHDEIEHRHRWHRQPTDPSHVAGEDEDVDEGVLALLANSIHSDHGHDASRQRVSWSIERHRPRSGSLGQPSVVPNVPPLRSQMPAGRGRALERAPDEAPDVEVDFTASKRQASRASRRGGTMVFLGMWALFGIGTLAVSRAPNVTPQIKETGRVLAVEREGGANSMINLNDSIPVSGFGVFQAPSSRIRDMSSLTFLFDQPLNERIIGRVFAWLCTTLYLTSRLPQIWKNYVRKSVEGLSMYLFVFAFLGNVFYVASILTSPNMGLPPEQALAFLKESIPYLLGSGGTLMFDITIVGQSFLYRSRHRRQSHMKDTEEEAALLAGESPGDSTQLPRGRTSRVRGSV